ncbi:MAG: tetratricopeptide repeat-containing glycosyltransferase family protein [Tepidisphaeraceae bacterium]|jgi:tetratricopeptide (TPR) repeat protein
MPQVRVDRALQKAQEQHRAGRFAEAEVLCAQILREQPKHRDALHLLSIVAMQTGRIEMAVDLAARAAAAHPLVAELHANLGAFSRQAGKLDQSVASFRRAIAIKPHEPTFRNSLGLVLGEKRQPEIALKEFERAIQLKPDYADAYGNLGGALRELGRLDEAHAAMTAAVRLQPGMATPHQNLALVLADQRKFSEAIDSYRRAIAIQPDFRQAHWDLGMLYLLLGDLERGWREYEWRPGVAVRFAQPQWTGEDLHGKTILLYAEQGFGDAIQFVRYVPMVAARGARIVLACHEELTRLMSDVAPVVMLGQPLPPFDVHCSLLSLPLAMGTTRDNIPAHVPYLKPGGVLSAKWRQRLGEKRGKLRVGLVWAGRPEHPNDARRSVRFEQLTPLLAVDGVEFVSLQKGVAIEQTSAARMIDFTSELDDFSDTAALIESLDLVITVDTAVAHLAGAMGKAVWVLLPSMPDWRWMLDREDSPWYPTMRLFRQRDRGDWSVPIERMGRELAARVTGQRRAPAV